VYLPSSDVAVFASPLRTSGGTRSTVSLVMISSCAWIVPTGQAAPVSPHSSPKTGGAQYEPAGHICGALELPAQVWPGVQKWVLNSVSK
jgi:hypothetical protein